MPPPVQCEGCESPTAAATQPGKVQQAVGQCQQAREPAPGGQSHQQQGPGELRHCQAGGRHPLAEGLAGWLIGAGGLRPVPGLWLTRSWGPLLQVLLMLSWGLLMLGLEQLAGCCWAGAACTDACPRPAAHSSSACRLQSQAAGKQS